jgi:hypothetical protein
MPRAYPKGVLLLGAPHGQAPALISHIRLGCKGLPVTNTKAYYELSKITAVKSFITVGSGLIFATKNGVVSNITV